MIVFYISAFVINMLRPFNQIKTSPFDLSSRNSLKHDSISSISVSLTDSLTALVSKNELLDANSIESEWSASISQAVSLMKRITCDVLNKLTKEDIKDLFDRPLDNERNPLSVEWEDVVVDGDSSSWIVSHWLTYFPVIQWKMIIKKREEQKDGYKTQYISSHSRDDYAICIENGKPQIYLRDPVLRKIFRVEEESGFVPTTINEVYKIKKSEWLWMSL